MTGTPARNALAERAPSSARAGNTARNAPAERAPSSARAGDTVDALSRLLDPRSIAVVGASADPAKRGYQAVRALRDAGYPHPVYPVNPRGGELFGLTVRRSVAELPPGVDAALVALPGRAVPGALRELAGAGVAGAVVLANGFRESGAAGASLEAELAAAIADTGIRVIGPNTSGILNTASGANLVGVPDPAPGPVSVLSQSGNMLLSLLADDRALGGPGLHCYVGLGNQADVGYHECLRVLAGQPGTGAVAVHAEGLGDGRAFLVEAAAADRPVVLLRGGRSDAGRAAALSHTGSVASSDAVATAVLAQAGVELVDRSDELAMLAGVLAVTMPMPAGRGVAVLSDGGGHATLAADALTAAGVPLATLAGATRSRLRALLGPPAAVVNPVDVAGATDTDPTRFVAATEALMTDPAVGLVLLVGLFGGYHLRFGEHLKTAEETTAADLAALAGRHGMPLLVHSCYTVDRPAAHHTLRAAGVPVLASIDHAVRATAALHRRAHRRATRSRRSALRLPSPVSEKCGYSNTSHSRAVDEPAARRLVQAAGIDTGPWWFARTAAEAAALVQAHGGPCALKVISPQAPHKSDVGGVRLGVTADAANAAWRGIVTDVTTALPDAVIDGMVVAPMASRGVELLVGATVDPVFGPVVAFGSGGVLVEALRDVTFRAAPFTHLEALEMIEETVAARLLDGYRHLPAVDRDALAEFLVRIGELAVATPELVELDVNPVLARGETLLPLDVRLVLRSASPPG